MGKKEKFQRITRLNLLIITLFVDYRNGAISAPFLLDPHITLIGRNAIKNLVDGKLLPPTRLPLTFIVMGCNNKGYLSILVITCFYLIFPNHKI
jgi:hypothetical protein